jgi:hypothetical protein
MGFTGLLAAFGAHPPTATCEIAYDSVTGRIYERASPKGEFGLSIGNTGDDRRNVVARGTGRTLIPPIVCVRERAVGDISQTTQTVVPQQDIVDGRVEVKGESGRAASEVVKDLIKNRVGPSIFIHFLMVARALLNQNLRKNPGFASVGVESCGAMHSHTDFGGRVSTQHGTVLHKGHAGTMARCGNGRTKSRQAAAANNNVVNFCLGFHGMFHTLRSRELADNMRVMTQYHS